MKTLANCNPVEFFVQTSKIRKAVDKWLSLTKIMEIRKRIPAIDEKASEEENKKILENQIRENANAILDAILDEYPVETAELLGLMCFIEPDDLHNYQVKELLGAFSELINTPEVIDFFVSLRQLVK